MSHASTRIHLRRSALLATATTLAALGLAAPAGAATADLVSGTLSIQDDPGRASTLTVGEVADPLGASRTRILVDLDRPIVAPEGCTHPVLLILADPSALLCDRAAVRLVSIDLGDGDDTLLRPLALGVLGIRATPLSGTPIEADAGPGRDALQGGDGADTLLGDDGDDDLLGFGGDDTIIGGLGADRVEPGAGANTVDVATPEADTVALTAGSTSTVRASANDLFLGAVETATVTLPGPVDPAVVTASVRVDAEAPAATATAAATADVALPAVDDLLRGVAGVTAGGSPPAGVTLPLQPVLGTLSGIAGRLAADLRLTPTLSVALPSGITLDDDGLHIDADCETACEISGNGVIDGGDGIAPLTPATVTSQGRETARLNLGIGHEYTRLARPVRSGRCAVVVARLRVSTARGSEVVSYALPACGAQLTFAPARRPVVTARHATRRLVVTATCSATCEVTPRFLLVKRGGRVIARTTAGAVRPAGPARAHTTVWKLTAAQERAITRAGRRSPTTLRYIVSAKATSGGVTTTGTASFRTRRT